MKTFIQFLTEGQVDHEDHTHEDHTKNPYHKTLTKYGFHHVSTRHEKSPFDFTHNDTMHRYEHGSHPGNSVTIIQHHSKGNFTRKHNFTHHYKLWNGNMSVSSGDTKPKLDKNLKSHYGSTK